MTPSLGITPQTIGNYQILRLLGEGGMGQVFLAERLQIGGRVALKVLHANFANHPEMAARFFNEARAANSVEHAGIVKVYEYGRLPDGGAFIAMEFVDGPSLRHRLTEQRKLSPQTASRLARQMATALAAAHARGVVHRESTPPSIPSRKRSGTGLGKRRENRSYIHLLGNGCPGFLLGMTAPVVDVESRLRGLATERVCSFVVSAWDR